MALSNARMRGESSGALGDMYTSLKKQVSALLASETPFSSKALDDSLCSLFDDHSPSFLALPHQYFDSHTAADIAKHVATLIGAQGCVGRRAARATH